MARSKLTKVQQLLTAIIKEEGGEVVDVRKGGNHLKIDYTFDHAHFFTTHAPHSMAIPPRWMYNFRSEIRKNKKRENS